MKKNANENTTRTNEQFIDDLTSLYRDCREKIEIENMVSDKIKNSSHIFNSNKTRNSFTRYIQMPVTRLAIAATFVIFVFTSFLIISDNNPDSEFGLSSGDQLNTKTENIESKKESNYFNSEDFLVSDNLMVYRF